MLSRIVPAAAIALCPVVVFADVKVDIDCVVAEGSNSACVPMVGCFGKAGAYFTGRAVGWGKGTLAVQTSTGVFCSGTWVSKNAIGVGQADFYCDDGDEGMVLFTYQHPETGTTVGRGMTDGGSTLQVWSGLNIRQFLADDAGNVDGNLLCGGVLVPLS